MVGGEGLGVVEDGFDVALEGGEGGLAHFEGALVLVELGEDGAVLELDADDVLGDVEEALLAVGGGKEFVQLLLHLLAVLVALLHFPGAGLGGSYPW